MAEKTNTVPRTLCLADILRRMETGETARVDAVYMSATLQGASETIDALQAQLVALTQRLMSRGRLQ